MPTYEIITTPGKEVIFPLEGDQAPRTQDEAKIIVQRLRAEAKVEGRQVDFIIRPTSGPGVGPRASANGAAATSVRLSEENRAKVARFCGRMMMTTGMPLTMGDAVARLIDHFDKTIDLLDPETLELSEDRIVAAARAIRLARKAAEGDAA